MDAKAYLKRIKFSGIPGVDVNTLIKLHQHHVWNVPFENLDVQHGIKIRLEPSALFEKIVTRNRGGFCYELNYLFHDFLVHLGFTAKLISARIFNGKELGPKFDHMAVLVTIAQEHWLADVGFGDLFVSPLRIGTADVQYDGRGYFKIVRTHRKELSLQMRSKDSKFENKYLFDTDSHDITAFASQCEYKQHSPDSHFVKNKIVTLPYKEGRKTIFNSKYICRSGADKTEYTITSEKEEVRILKEAFQIELGF